MNKILLSLILVSILACSKNFCDKAHATIKDGAFLLEARWDCQKKGCLMEKMDYSLDKTFCLKYPANDRLAISLICTAATQSLAFVGASLIHLSCQCDVMKVYLDLQKPSALCPLFGALP